MYSCSRGDDIRRDGETDMDTRSKANVDDVRLVYLARGVPGVRMPCPLRNSPTE
jgi:hypothetical protein